MSGDNKTLTIRLIGDSRSAERAASRTGVAYGSLSSRMSRLSDKFKNVGSGLNTVGRRMSYVSLAALYFVGKAGASYVNSLNKIQVLTSSNDKTMKGVAQRLEKNSGLYAKMGQTTGDAAGGVVELAKAGLSLDKSMAAVRSTMILARAGEMSVADASVLVAETLNTFHLKAARAADIANYLANAANISSANVTDLAESFKYVSPIAAQSGVSMKHMSALLAELSNSGVKASLAGTGLRKFLLSLQAPAGKGAAAIKRLGVSIFDASGNMRPIGALIDDLGAAMDRLTQEKRARALRDIFGLTGANAAQIILKGGAKALDKYSEGVTKAGAAQRLANAQSKGLAGTLARLKASVTSIAQSLYREFSPALDGIAKHVAKFAEGFGDLSPGARKMIAIFAALAIAAGPVLLILGGLAAAIGALLSPVGAVMAIIAAVAIAFGAAYASSESFRNAVASLAAGIGPLISAVGGFLKSLIPVFKEIGAEFMERVAPALKQLGDLIKTELVPAFQKILPIVQPILGFLLKMFGSAVIGAIMGFIQVIKGVVQVISGVFSLVSDLIHGRWKAVWHDLWLIVKGVFNILIGAFKVWWNAGILAIFKHGLVSVLGVFKGGWRKVLSFGKSAVSLLGKIASVVVKVLTLPFRLSMRLMLSIVKGGFNLVMRVVRGIGHRITGVFKGAGRWLWNAGKSIIQGLIDGIKYMTRPVTNAIGGILSKARNLLPFSPAKEGPFSGKGWTLYSGMSIAQSLADGIESKVRRVRDAARGLANAAHPGTLTASLAGFGGSAGSLSSGGYLRRSADGSGVTVHVTVEGNVIGEKDFAKRVAPTIRDEFSKVRGRNGGNLFGKN